ncbi:hypothetical protein DNH61_06010 [Paenibacillus sambharensis]|uniref:Uncharacterized protein n=1 Tax=Paenibacillus sambharensis TaxID=1803190 RepID=A0A2W1LDL3_9BACL|nr:hypothetical protein [Paenibacillus sambharensis]PZD96749.1 hypothetical protein DNH61_06010 [Paenibacillus sambharensis]
MFKILSSILAALVFSGYAVYLNDAGGEPGTAGYSAFYEFGMGFVLLFFSYLCVGIPLSVLADQYVRGARRYLKTIAAYFVGGIVIGLLFVIVRGFPGEPSSRMILILQFGAAGLLFGVCQTALKMVFTTLGKRIAQRYN